MDLNQLYFDHQILLMRAGEAATPERRLAHQKEAARIANRIGGLQRLLGATAAQAWTVLVDAAVPPPHARGLHGCGA